MAIFFFFLTSVKRKTQPRFLKEGSRTRDQRPTVAVRERADRRRGEGSALSCVGRWTDRGRARPPFPSTVELERASVGSSVVGGAPARLPDCTWRGQDGGSDGGGARLERSLLQGICEGCA